MQQVELNKDLEKIIKEGFLEKQSRFLKSWRKRWFVLTPQTLYTFKERKVYNSPTEVLPLRSVTSIKSCDDQTHKQHSFRVDTAQRSYYMSTENTNQKEQWIGQIGKAMVKLNVKETDFE